MVLLLAAGLLFAGASFFGGVLVGEHRAGVDLPDKQGAVNTTAEANGSGDAGAEEAVLPVPAETASGRVIGEFEHQAAIMIGCNEMLAYHPRTLIQMVSALRGNVKVIGLVWSEEQRKEGVALLKANGLPDDSIDFYVWPSKSMWVRDYGPFFLMQGRDGPATVIDYAYDQPNRDYGDLFSATFAATFGYKFERAELSFEGGNLLTNGDGLCVTTNRLLQQNASRGYDPQNPTQIEGILGSAFKFNRWAHLMPLDGEPTGHADMFCTICGPNQVVVGSYTQEQDSVNADILDKSAATLAQQPTSHGPMQVARIPMPSHRDDNWRSYTNVLYANGTLLVPQYFGDDTELDKVALAAYQKLMPDWKIVGIDCSTLAEKRGALHCISFNIPFLPAKRR